MMYLNSICRFQVWRKVVMAVIIISRWMGCETHLSKKKDLKLIDSECAGCSSDCADVFTRNFLRRKYKMNLCSSKLKASKGSRWSERLFVCPEASYRTVMSCVCLSRVVSLCSELEESFWPWPYIFCCLRGRGQKVGLQEAQLLVHFVHVSIE